MSKLKVKSTGKRAWSDSKHHICSLAIGNFLLSFSLSFSLFFSLFLSFIICSLFSPVDGENFSLLYVNINWCKILQLYYLSEVTFSTYTSCWKTKQNKTKPPEIEGTIKGKNCLHRGYWGKFNLEKLGKVKQLNYLWHIYELFMT